MQYTTHSQPLALVRSLFYQDFKDTFVCNTQRMTDEELDNLVVLSGFQRYFCMQYTTCASWYSK